MWGNLKVFWMKMQNKQTPAPNGRAAWSFVILLMTYIVTLYLKIHCRRTLAANEFMG